jgi:hypothetical protein
VRDTAPIWRFAPIPSSIGSRIDRDRALAVRLVEPAAIVVADQIIPGAGVYGSPAILLRSGIGPAREYGALRGPGFLDRSAFAGSRIS